MLALFRCTTVVNPRTLALWSNIPQGQIFETRRRSVSCYTLVRLMVPPGIETQAENFIGIPAHFGSVMGRPR